MHYSDITKDGNIPNYVPETKDLTIHALLVWQQHPTVGLRNSKNLKFLHDEGNAFMDSNGGKFSR